ncbi:MAG: hypothetical protein CMG74_13080 [Candidatus Marinimicrobia bacterium]|nr:hypothetical protein [Candidatus Neomarinimicrobiota bacterium]|tara:strand:+ start:42814 stop:43494 length:681 start_codon:yes stop_codon:yes gene_type:complete
MICSIIPARGGSKSIYKKNITALGDKPLIYYTIQAALGSKTINKVVVSTDDHEIAEIAKKLNVDILKRPKYLSTDNAKMLPVIQHAIKKIKLDNFSEKLIILQPTSPLRRSIHIDQALPLLNGRWSSVVSVCEAEHTPYKMYKRDKNKLIDFVSKKYRGENKQSLPTVYRENGAIYICWIKNIIEGKFRGSNIRPYLMSQINSIDIDSNFDLTLCEHIIKKPIVDE